MNIDQTLLLFIQDYLRSDLLSGLLCTVTVLGNKGAIWLALLLMLLPFSTAKSEAEDKPDRSLEEILACSRGVGEARVLVSESGVVVVCRGADDAAVRLDMIRAIHSYTGFGSDKITILKLAD